MTYQDSIRLARQGKTIMLTNFKGYFNWDYNRQKLVFSNEGYKCDADQLDILDRTDFYYII